MKWRHIASITITFYSVGIQPLGPHQSWNGILRMNRQGHSYRGCRYYTPYWILIKMWYFYCFWHKETLSVLSLLCLLCSKCFLAQTYKQNLLEQELKCIKRVTLEVSSVNNEWLYSKVLRPFSSVQWSCSLVLSFEARWYDASSWAHCHARALTARTPCVNIKCDSFEFQSRTPNSYWCWHDLSMLRIMCHS